VNTEELQVPTTHDAARAATTLLTSLYRRGVKLWIERGQLHFQAPPGTLGAGDQDRLKQLKPEIVRLLQRARPDAELPLVPRPAGTPAPLTAMQMRWITRVLREQRLSRRWGKLGTRLKGRLDLRILRESLETLVQRHETLRTRIVRSGNQLFQEAFPAGPCMVEPIDVSAGSTEESFAKAMQLTRELVYHRIDIYKEPLFVFRLFRLSADDHVLVLLSDHLISDGFSKQILTRELWTAYRQLEAGLPVCLPRSPIQFPDYALWQEQTRAAWFEKHAHYWTDKFAGARRLRLPADEGLPQMAEPVGTVARIPFGASLSTALHDLARREQSLTALVVLTAYCVAISQWCGQRDLVITVQSNGRIRPQLEHVTGYISNQLFLRIPLHEHDRYIDLLKRVQAEYWTSHEHRDYDRVPGFVKECQSDLYASDVYFNWQPFSAALAATPPWQEGEQLRIEALEIELPPPSRFLPLFLDRQEGIQFVVMFREDAFRRATVESFGKRLIAVATELVADPRARLAPLP
jgi:hypothetical protein